MTYDQKNKFSLPSGIVVSDADCCAIGFEFRYRKRHGCLQMYRDFVEWGHSKQPSSCKSSSEDILHLEFSPEGHIVNKEFYVDILRRLHEVKYALQAELKDMAKNGFHKCFDDKRRQKCVVAQGFYFEEG
ncbi:hypothetical protein TNCV_469431 [Trichonephila clavipes]|nr:hypothetical protein TNCV_469431 [Trichonephila clavipes]